MWFNLIKLATTYTYKFLIYKMKTKWNLLGKVFSR